MKITRCMLATLLVVVMVNVSHAQVGVNGSRVEENFNYAAGSLNGQSGGGEANLNGSNLHTPPVTWNSTGDIATPGDPFIVRPQDLTFGPQETLFDNPTLGSIGRNPQLGVGGATRLIGNGNNLNVQTNITNNGKESFTQLKMVWNGGKVGFAVANQAFDLSNFSVRLIAEMNNATSGWGFTVESDGADPNIGILKSTVFRTFNNGTSGNTLDSGAGIQLTKGDTYHVFIHSQLTNDATFEDQISVFALSEADVANPEATVYLDDLPATSKSFVQENIFNNFQMRDELKFSMYASQSFEADDLGIGWMDGGATMANFNDDAVRDPARQALLAFRTVNQKIAWKSSLGDPYVAGDTRLDGVLLGSATNNDVSSNDIDLLQGQIRLGNTSTVSYLDLDSSGVIDDADVEFLVETLYGSSIADFDLDFDVDADDLAAWSAEYGNAGGWTQGDANGSGVIDGGDFLSWQRNFTGTPSVGATSAVPEPTTVLLAMLAGVASLATRRRRLM